MTSIISILFFQARPAFGQSCTGNVLYKQDFGGNASSPDIGPPLSDSVTSYIYTTGTIVDGDYSIRKTVPNTFPHWLSGTDHSGNGYMMVINASYDPGLFYQTRIDGLCQGSSFYFSAWIANLLRAGSSDPLDPNIEFVIRNVVDSSIIAEYTTGTLPRYSTLTWTQYGINFNLPAGQSSVLLQMFNHQTGGDGNDLVLDDITFSLCGPAIQISTTGVYQNTQDVCEGNPVSFHAVIDTGFYKIPVCQWQFSKDSTNWQNLDSAVSTTLNISHTSSADSGWYRLLVAEEGNINSPNCRIASQPIFLYVGSPQPFAIRGSDSLCAGTALHLSAPSAIGYQWSGPNGFTSTQDSLVFDPVSVNDQGTYKLILTTRGGCTSSAQKEIFVQANDLNVSIRQDSVLCQGSAITLNAANSGAGYQWNTGQQSSMINVDTPGFYKVVVYKGVCTASDSVTVNEILKPVVNLGDDTTICVGEPYTLNAAFQAAESYLWQDGSVDSVYQVSQTGTYSVTVSNSCGTAMSTVHINTEECADHLLFPTAFSPNGDGMNDFFRPKAFLMVSHYEMKVFDRWGNLVFRTNNLDTGWNGTSNGISLPVGTYVWIA
ncbi:MAG: gliding motility-associated C-terminal domain-containing protein, partial [Chitinophagaceae bacterium]